LSDFRFLPPLGPCTGLISTSLAQCICAQVGCGYSGGYSQCFCWAQQTANLAHQTGTVTYFPNGEFSTGGCTYCPTGPGNGNMVFYVDVFYCNGGSHQDPVSGITECNLYIGDDASCMYWCNATAVAEKFAGTFQCTYIPNAEFSQGSCMVTGYQNPCTVSFDSFMERKEEPVIKYY